MCSKCWSLKGALCAALHAGSRGERALFAEGAGGVSIRYKVVERVCYVLELLEGMRCVLWVPEVVFYVLELLEPGGVALCATIRVLNHVCEKAYLRTLACKIGVGITRPLDFISFYTLVVTSSYYWLQCNPLRKWQRAANTPYSSF